MIVPNTHSILNNFDLSIILPFYHKLDDFRTVLPINAHYFQNNGIEVIIVLDEPSEKEGVLNLLKGYPFINWIVLVNYEIHDWRNPATAINAGIKASTKQYILICSPESVFENDAIFHLRLTCEFYENCFAYGQVFFKLHGETVVDTDKGVPYGSIMTKKSFLENVGCYSSFFSKWGGEDDNIRAKLEYSQIAGMYVPEARLIHYEAESKGFQLRTDNHRKLSHNVKHRAFYPIKEDFVIGSENLSTFETVYVYYDSKCAEHLCKAYLSNFLCYELTNKNPFAKKSKVLVLIQVYNEISNLEGVLQHLDKICDGIILLDDGSTDGTYDEARSEKLLLKVKKHRIGFNDLQNRNILLDLASFFKSDWILFLDADERLHFKEPNLSRTFEILERSSYCFSLVHLWDDNEKYRCDLPEKSYTHLPGVLHRWRAFRNIGRMQILSNRNLHFIATPYQDKIKTIAPVLILHSGMMSRKTRLEKYKRYLKEDSPERAGYYSYFLDENVELRSVSDLKKNLFK